MSNEINEAGKDVKNPNEDSIVTSNHLGGKKVDADPEKETDQPVEDGNLISEESQKGKKVDADLDNENEKPTTE
ncbi:MAG: hypothetical protein WKF89_06065 [Chitinophagaceae bacterium]